MLKDHADIPPHQTQFFIGQFCQILAVYNHITGSRLFQQVQAAYQCTFARAGQTDDSKNIAAFDIETDILCRVDHIIPLPERSYINVVPE